MGTELKKVKIITKQFTKEEKQMLNKQRYPFLPSRLAVIYKAHNIHRQ